MRYFFYSAIFSDKFGGTNTNNFGAKREEMPGNEDLKALVRLAFDGATRITILSICELSEDDYYKFWRGCDLKQFQADLTQYHDSNSVL